MTAADATTPHASAVARDGDAAEAGFRATAPEAPGSAGAPAAARRPMPAAMAAGQALDALGASARRLAAGLGRSRGRTRGRRTSVGPRLLPAVIFCAVLMLGVRVGDIWHQLTVAEALDPGRSSQAQDQGVVEDQAQAVEGEAAQALAVDAAAAEGEAAEPSAPVASGPSGALAGVDPASLDQTQLALLEDLAARRTAMDERARTLDERQAMIEVAERRLDEKIVELDRLRGEIEGLMGRLDEESEARIANLAAIYEAMRPGDAAAIFNGLEMDVIVAVLDRMRQTKSASILAGMDPARAREVTAELAQRRETAMDAAAAVEP